MRLSKGATRESRTSVPASQKIITFSVVFSSSIRGLNLPIEDFINREHVIGMMKIPDCFYRVSVKGLIYKSNKVLLCQEKDGLWDLPGGGLNFGEELKEALKREIKEELSVNVTKIEEKPTFIWTQERHSPKLNCDIHCLFLAYKIEVNSLKFKPSDEAQAIEFFSKDELNNIELHPNVYKFKELF